MAASLSRSVKPQKIARVASASLGSGVEVNVKHCLTVLRLPTGCQDGWSVARLSQVSTGQAVLFFFSLHRVYEVVVILVVLWRTGVQW